MVTVLTNDNFAAETASTDMPVLVDCYADWCGPCKMMAPLVEKMSELFEGKLKVCKINVDDNEEAIAPFRVMSIPTFLFFKNGELVSTKVGGMDPGTFQQVINEVLAM